MEAPEAKFRYVIRRPGCINSSAPSSECSCLLLTSLISCLDISFAHLACIWSTLTILTWLSASCAHLG